MYRVRVTSLNSRDSMLGRLVIRRRLEGDQWEYYSEIGWFKTEAEADGKAVTYLHKNLRVEVIWQDLGSREERLVRHVRDIEPQHIYEAKLNARIKRKATPLDMMKAAIVKLGVAFQMLCFFLIGSLGLIGGIGVAPEKALLLGGAVVVIFWFGCQMGKEAGKEEAKRGLSRV